MKGVRKEFEADLYNLYDSPAKEAMRIHLTAYGHIVTVPPENYGVDLYSEVGDLKMYHEVEVSEGWKKNEHPFHMGSIPERKYRLCQMLKGKPLYFWMLRFDLGRAVVFSSAKVHERWLVEVPNKKVPKGEYFYRIPKTLGKEFDLICPD